MIELRHLVGVVLAGGLGTRLRSVVADRPKALADIGGQPFLTYLLEQLAHWQVREIVLCTGYLGDQIKERFGSSYKGLRLTYSTEIVPMGTAGALGLALSTVDSDTVLVMNGDSYCAADLGAFWNFHTKRSASASVLLVSNADTTRFGRVLLASDGRIVKFQEKTASAGPGLVNAGVYLIRRSLLQSLPAGEPSSLERDVFPTWIGKDFFGFDGNCPFIDIGTPETYAAAEAFLTKHARSA